MSVLVLDATVLSHFARTGNLDVLESLLAGHRCVMPAEVAWDLAGTIPDHPAVARAIDLHWVELDGLAEIMAFAKYKTEFGAGRSETMAKRLSLPVPRFTAESRSLMNVLRTPAPPVGTGLKLTARSGLSPTPSGQASSTRAWPSASSTTSPHPACGSQSMAQACSPGRTRKACFHRAH